MRGAMVVALAAGLAGCGVPEPPPSTGTAAYVESVVRDAGHLALARGRAGFLYDGVTMRVATTDKYGNAGSAPALSFTWRASDLGRVNWETIDDYRLLDLGRVTIDGRDGVQALHAWCYGDPDTGPVLTPRLCGNEYTRAVGAFMAG